jgi:antitoxin HicB
MSTVDDYIDLPYKILLTADEDEDGHQGWVAEVLELPGVLSQGETIEEAAENVRDAMAGWLSVAIEDGKPIPRPRDTSYSGRFLIRIPASLHARLTELAELEGVSLNQFVSNALAAAADWRREPQCA